MVWTTYVLRVLIEEPKPKRRRGSMPGRAPAKDRNTASGHENIMRDYLSAAPIYSASDFRRRFRLPRQIFDRLVAELPSIDPWLQQKADCTGKRGPSTVQLVTAALRMLAYGAAADATDEYCRVSESTVRVALRRVAAAIVTKYEATYLRSPTKDDIDVILKENANRGFPGMIGSLDCMHWYWAKCPRAWAGQMTGKDGKPSMVLEAVATSDLWIWHCFFSVAGSCNDLNVLDRSPLLHKIYNGDKYDCSYVVNGTMRTTSYYLVDGIYPDWTVFVKSLTVPTTAKEQYFTKMQEAYRKDVERAFGVLQARWHILATPSKLWFRDEMGIVIKACVILHNMIVEFDKEHGAVNERLPVPSQTPPPSACSLSTMTTNMARVRDRNSRSSLRRDLIDHLWSEMGSRRS